MTYDLPYYDWRQPLKEGVLAVIMPPQSRRVELRVFHVPSDQLVLVNEELVRAPWTELAPLEWVPVPEGEWNEKPFATTTNYDDRMGSMAILQAMVDLGHKLGLTPSGAADRSAEIKALRAHLEDMRWFAGARMPKPPGL